MTHFPWSCHIFTHDGFDNIHAEMLGKNINISNQKYVLYNIHLTTDYKYNQICSSIIWNLLQKTCPESRRNATCFRDEDVHGEEGMLIISERLVNIYHKIWTCSKFFMPFMVRMLFRKMKPLLKWFSITSFKRESIPVKYITWWMFITWYMWA